MIKKIFVTIIFILIFSITISAQEKNIYSEQYDLSGAEEITEANTECSHGKTGNILIGSECYGQEAEQQTHQQRTDQAECGRDQHRQEGHHCLGIGQALLIQECADNAANTADIHDTGNTQVHIAGLLGDDLTGGTEQQRGALGDGTGQERKDGFKHGYLPSFLIALTTKPPAFSPV